jgi:hypothetical protein
MGRMRQCPYKTSFLCYFNIMTYFTPLVLFMIFLCTLVVINLVSKLQQPHLLQFQCLRKYFLGLSRISVFAVVTEIKNVYYILGVVYIIFFLLTNFFLG